MAPQSSGIQADAQVLQQTAKQVEGVNGNIQSQLVTLFNDLESLPAGWAGDSATAFYQLMERWNTDAQQLNTALAGIAEALGGSGGSYQTAETTLQDEAKKIHSQMPPAKL